MRIDTTTNRPLLRLAGSLAIAGAVLPATAAFASDLSGGAPEAPAVRSEVDVLTAASAFVNRELNLSDSTFVQLDLPATPGAFVDAAIEIDGQWMTLSLAPHSVRSANYQLYTQADDGTLVPEPAGPIRTLRGSILEMPGSFVAGSLLEEGLEAMIDLGDGSARFWVEPVDDLVEGMPEGTHALYRDGDMNMIAGACGTVGADGEPEVTDDGGAEGGIAGGCVDLFVTELACDTDHEYYLDFNGNTSAVEAQINNIINTMNNQYENQVQITHEITTIIVRSSPNDPYSDDNQAGVILSEFRSHWLSAQGGVQRDVAQIFTGKAIAGSTIGIAWTIGGICTNGAYCVSENINGFGCRTDLSAHELGHLWGCFHCSGGCSTTMNSGLTCANNFNSTSINSATNHRNSRTCLMNDCIPANDVCVNATTASGGLTAFDTASSFNDGPSETLCNNNGSNTLENDIWFSYVPPCSGEYTIDLCGSSFNTRLAVYDFTCPDLVNLAVVCNDDACGSGGTRSSVTFEAFGGLQYYVRVAGFNGASGTGVMDIIEPECLPAPSNDDCGSAEVVSLGATAYSSIGATTDGFDESGCDGSSTFLSDVWFRYFALADGTLTVDVDGDFDPKVAVYGAACPAGADEALGCNDDGVGLAPSLTIPVSAFQIYRIRVGSGDGSTGSGTLTLSDGPVDDPCPGDADENGMVDIDDVVFVVLNFGNTGAPGIPGDVDENGMVDIDDVVFVVLNFGNPCP